MTEKTSGGTPEDERTALASRLQTLRRELFGEQGGPELARPLKLPARTLYDYETGAPIPGEVLVLLVERTEDSP
jgi:hypothetical protein